MSTKTKTEYLIQRDYGTERNHKWVNCITMYDYDARDRTLSIVLAETSIAYSSAR